MKEGGGDAGFCAPNESRKHEGWLRNATFTNIFREAENTVNIYRPYITRFDCCFWRKIYVFYSAPLSGNRTCRSLTTRPILAASAAEHPSWKSEAAGSDNWSPPGRKPAAFTWSTAHCAVCWCEEGGSGREQCIWGGEKQCLLHFPWRLFRNVSRYS
jgi:hypothetical protein